MAMGNDRGFLAFLEAHLFLLRHGDTGTDATDQEQAERHRATPQHMLYGIHDGDLAVVGDHAMEDALSSQRVAVDEVTMPRVMPPTGTGTSGTRVA